VTDSPVNCFGLQDHLCMGGAARAANRWSDLLHLKGFRIQKIVGDQNPGSGYCLTGKPARGWGRICECFTDRSEHRRASVHRQFGMLLAKEKPDLVWVHNLAGGGKWGWSEGLVSMSRLHAPVIWTLHDMWALGNSDQAYWDESPGKVERERMQGRNRGKKEGAGVSECEESRVKRICGELGMHPVTLTAPSNWLAKLTLKTAGQSCVCLPNPIDLEFYSPGDRAEARHRLGLPEQGLVVLAGADSLQDPRKGFDLLLEAWERLCPGDAILALFGRHGKKRKGQVYLGSLNSDRQMVTAYRAANLYVHPARQENAPCTIQESLACGTPVLAFGVGGIPEMVVPENTGFLAGEVSACSMSEELGRLLDNSEKLERMRSDCRRFAEDKWEPKKLKVRFEEITGELVPGSKAKR